MNPKFIQDNILYILICIIIVGAGFYGIFQLGVKAIGSFGEVASKRNEFNTKQQELNTIIKQKQREKLAKENKLKKQTESGKVIYEVPGAQFTPEASYGIMFENVLASITNSGLRIRTIDYNYNNVADDKIKGSGAPGYNVCELGFVTVGTYPQLQSFFENITKEKFLSAITEIYLEPYDQDKTILIAKFKIRLYTKTV